MPNPNAPRDPNSPRYFIGFVPEEPYANNLIAIQNKIREGRKDKIAAPLYPHITILPPPITSVRDQGELVNASVEMLRSKGWDRRRIRGTFHPVAQHVAFLDGKGRPLYALTSELESPDVEELRADMQGLVGETPQTKLHLTYARPFGNDRLPDGRNDEGEPDDSLNIVGLYEEEASALGMTPASLDVNIGNLMLFTEVQRGPQDTETSVLYLPERSLLVPTA